jgi:hypothetical protein
MRQAELITPLPWPEVWFIQRKPNTTISVTSENVRNIGDTLSYFRVPLDAHGDAVSNSCFRIQIFVKFLSSILPTNKYSFAVINKGQVMTQYYRIMNKNGGYTWMQTCATVVCNSKNAEEQNVICVNYVITYVIFNYFQLCSVVKIISSLTDLDVCRPPAPLLFQ